MPAMQKAVKEFFGKEPHMGVNPDEAFIAPVQTEAAKSTDTEALIKAAVDAAVKAALEAVNRQ